MYFGESPVGKDEKFETTLRRGETLLPHDFYEMWTYGAVTVRTDLPAGSISLFPSVRIFTLMLLRSLSSFRIGVIGLALALCAPLAFGQLPQGNQKTVSSSDVSDEEVQKVARIAVTAQMSTRQERMKLRKEMRNKYGNPQEMDSTQKAQARREVRKRQMAMRKKTMKVMQKEANKEGMDPQRVQTILRSARQDSTLGNRLRTAMKAEAKKQRPSPQGGGGPQGGAGGN